MPSEVRKQYNIHDMDIKCIRWKTVNQIWLVINGTGPTVELLGDDEALGII